MSHTGLNGDKRDASTSTSSREQSRSIYIKRQHSVKEKGNYIYYFNFRERIRISILAVENTQIRSLFMQNFILGLRKLSSARNASTISVPDVALLNPALDQQTNAPVTSLEVEVHSSMLK